MDASAYSIDLISASGGTERLLEVGDEVGAPLEFAIHQAAEDLENPGDWGMASGLGNARRTVVLDRVFRHASEAAAESFTQAYPARFPQGTTGKIRISIPGGEVWEMQDVVVLAVRCRRLGDPTATLTTWQVAAGKTVPVSGLAWYVGIPCYWDLLAHGEQSRTHDGSPGPAPVMPELPQLEIRMVKDTMGYWSEVGFNVFEELDGDPEAGFTVPSLPRLRMKILRSTDLVTWWDTGLEMAPGSPEEQPDGSWEYWVRGSVPSYWETVLLDQHIQTARYGKSITGITLHRTPISLPGYPYAMPAQAAHLQADLRAAGFTGATVSSSSAAMTATAANHTPTSKQIIRLTMSGTSITAAADSYGAPITSGMAYPYAMPSQRAALQTDLRNAGQSGAVVMLWGDEWQITLPDITSVGNVRDISLGITPGDPFPHWDMFGNYQGEAPATGVSGTISNVRDPYGSPLTEALRQFFRMKVSVDPEP